jgi:hypothetical protein
MDSRFDETENEDFTPETARVDGEVTKPKYK